MPNRFFWYDLMASDVAAAATFYTDVVGWSVRDSDGAAGSDYKLFTAGGAPAAGLMAIPAEVREGGGGPVWMGYVETADVDAAVARLRAAGGVVHREPTDIDEIIRVAVVADPQGAVFLIAKGLLEDPLRRPAEGAPGSVGWRELYAADGGAVFAFYEAMFGWTKSTAYDMGDMGTYQLFAIDGVDAGGIMTKPPFVPRPYWGYYVTVVAIDTAVERIAAGGGKVVHGPVEVPGGQWIVQAVDPQGARFNLVAPAR